ncbi:aminotransferase class IV [Cytophagaceae bacterium ABcell3]|nr:aminotransferase class IV [Cytophagaceae bacterium ABcell3]
MWSFYNNEFIHEENIGISLNDRAFQYGDGVFETMKVNNGKILFSDDHFERLTIGLKVLQLTLPIDLQTIYHTTTTLCKKNKIDNARAKIMIWRKPGGLFTPTATESNILIVCKPFSPAPLQKKDVLFAKKSKLTYTPTSQFKTLSALPYILAGLEKKERNSEDLILTNTSGEIAECISSNIFWVKNDIVYTPAINSGCIAGIVRKNIIKTCHEKGIPIQEGLYQPKDLLSSDIAFCSNIAGISIIKKIEDRSFEQKAIISDKIIATINKKLIF